jgi:hypothetical protein
MRPEKQRFFKLMKANAKSFVKFYDFVAGVESTTSEGPFRYNFREEWVLSVEFQIRCLRIIE